MFTEYHQVEYKFFINREEKEFVIPAASWVFLERKDWINHMLESLTHSNTGPTHRMRAAWFLDIGFDLHPELYSNWEFNIIEAAIKVPSSSERRSLLRMIAVHGHDANFDETLMDWLFQLLGDSSEAIAVKAHAVTILERIVLRYPDLAGEYAALLTAQLPTASAGMRSRVNRTLKTLKRQSLI